MEHPTHVTIDKLKLDEKANVRKTGTGADKAFIANIEAKGILVPLTVRPNGNGYLVTNGGKRLAALRAIADKQGSITVAEGKTFGTIKAANYLVPIHVRDENDADARGTSLASNIITAPMHPVDRYEAFSQMIADGATEAKLQTDFAMTEKEVKQVIALGKLSPSVRAAWREGKIGPKCAQAFTMSDSHKSQDKALKELLSHAARSESSSLDDEEDADDIKRAFKIPQGRDGTMLEFVGIEEYEKRGGKVTRDLFGTDHIVSNDKLVKKMVDEKIDAICDDLVKRDGWAWAARAVKNEHEYGKAKPKPVEPTAEEAAKLESLKAIYAGTSSYDFTREQDVAQAEHDELKKEIEARGYSAEQKAKAGCIVTLSYEGFIEINYGLVKPAAKKDVEALNKIAMKEARKSTGKQKEKKPNLDISNNLMAKLAEQLTKAAAEAIATNPVVALPAVISGFLCSYAGGCPVDVQSSRGRAAFGATFEAAMKKKPAEQLQALAQCAGPLVSISVRRLGYSPLKDPGTLAFCEALGAPLYAALKKHFDAKEYFSSVNGHICRQKLREMFGRGYQEKWETEKKGALEKIAITKARETGWLPPELRTSFYAPKKVA